MGFHLLLVLHIELQFTMVIVHWLLLRTVLLDRLQLPIAVLLRNGLLPTLLHLPIILLRKGLIPMLSHSQPTLHRTTPKSSVHLADWRPVSTESCNPRTNMTRKVNGGNPLEIVRRIMTAGQNLIAEVWLAICKASSLNTVLSKKNSPQRCTEAP